MNEMMIRWTAASCWCARRCERGEAVGLR